MIEKISPEQDTDPNEEVRKATRERLNALGQKDALLIGLLTGKKAVDLQKSHLNYDDYEMYHLLIGSQKPSYKYFDFPGEDSVQKWVEELEVTDRMHEMSDLYAQFMALSSKFFQLSEEFSTKKQGGGMWDNYKGEVNQILDDVKKGIESLTQLGPDVAEAQNIMDDVKEKIKKLQEAYELLNQRV